MKKLIIAEKPSLAKNVKNALSASDKFATMEYKNKGGKESASKLLFSSDSKAERKSIFYENSKYVITYAYGHLFDNGTLDDYLPEGVNGWSLDNLPVFPAAFKLIISDNEGVKKQFALIKYLLSRSDISEVVHCGDADREGELIIRNILNSAGNSKPVMRLWLPEQTAPTIIAAMNSLKPDSDYDLLAAEGEARTYMDWLFGFNYSRYSWCY